MTFPARPAKITSIQALCLGALLFTPTLAAAQSTDVDLFPPTQGGPAPAPIGAPPERAPTDLFVPRPPPAPPLPPPPHQEPRELAARWEMAGSLYGSIFTIHSGPAGNNSFDQHGNRGGVSAGPVVFLTPVVDNDAPRSLQPFLQRTSSVYASIFGGGFVTRYGNGAFTRKDSWVGANTGADVYLTRHFALTGKIEYEYDTLHDEPRLTKGHSFSGKAGFAVRFGDARIDASYDFRAYDLDGTFIPPPWGTVNLSAYLLIAQSFALTLSGHGGDGGGGGGLDLGFYTSKDLGVFAGVSGQSFVYAASLTHASYYTGSAGLSYWVTPSTRFYWSYELRLYNTPSQALQTIDSHEVEHTLSVSVRARLP